MAPKKTGLIASTPAVPSNPSTFRGIVDSSGPSSIEESSVFAINTRSISDDLPPKRNIVVPKRLTTLELMCKAIEVVGVPRKGASYISILKWIVSIKENVIIGRFKGLLKKTIIKALETGLLKRPAISKNSKGLQGYFLLDKEYLKKQVKSQVKTKALTKKQKDIKEPNASESLSDTELTKKPRKKNERLNKSASEIVGPKKVASNVTSKKFGVKKAPSKVEKEKASAPTTKVKATAESRANPKTTVSAPKTKAATTSSKMAKTAKALTKASVPKGVPSRKAKAAVEENPIIASSSNAKEVRKAAATAPKHRIAPLPKSKTVGNVEENIEAVGPVPKLKRGKPKPKRLVEIDQHEPEMSVEKKAAEKSGKKAVLKLPKTQKVVDNQPTTKKKLYTSRKNTVKNVPRKDLSDTELTVKPVNRKSLKSYASDTDIEELKKEKTVKKKKNTSVTSKTKTFVKETEAGPSKPKAIKKAKTKAAS